MIIQDIYNSFKILPSLQLHMLRVAAVTQEVCKQIYTQLPVTSETLITIALLHDLGNLVKFDMTLFPDLFEPEGIAYRTQQKQSTIQNHGFPAEPATLSMCTQLPLTQTTQKLLESFLSSRFEKAIEDQLPIQILLVHFADMHIGMSGYIPRKERVQKLRKRYIRNKNYSEQQADDITQEILQTGQHTYELLYSLGRDGSSLDPEYIDQQAALLRSFQII